MKMNRDDFREPFKVYVSHNHRFKILEYAEDLFFVERFWLHDEYGAEDVGWVSIKDSKGFFIDELCSFEEALECINKIIEGQKE